MSKLFKFGRGSMYIDPELIVSCDVIRTEGQWVFRVTSVAGFNYDIDCGSKEAAIQWLDKYLEHCNG